MLILTFDLIVIIFPVCEAAEALYKFLALFVL